MNNRQEANLVSAQYSIRYLCIYLLFLKLLYTFSLFIFSPASIVLRDFLAVTFILAQMFTNVSLPTRFPEGKPSLIFYSSY